MPLIISGALIVTEFLAGFGKTLRFLFKTSSTPRHAFEILIML